MSAAIETLQAPGVGYPVFLGPAGARVAGLVAGRDVLVVSDENVAAYHLPGVREQLATAARCRSLILPAGEMHKTLAGFQTVVDTLAHETFHRDAVLVALGGGVVGDLGGFAAACYQRGIDWIAVPTTLLAQVDAAIGGKTGVNHPRGKNLIGAFHDPLAVWADPAHLVTLPPREFRAGLAEVVKYGLGLDAGFFAWLEAHAQALACGTDSAVREAVRRSVQLKLGVVAEDRTERGRRALLNLGHTVGHALETALGHGAWLHGEAVAVGLVAATALAAARGTVETALPARVRALLQCFSLPVALPADLDRAALAEALAIDKKIAAGRLRFIGLRALGAAEIWDDVAAQELAAALDAAAGPTRADC